MSKAYWVNKTKKKIKEKPTTPQRILVRERSGLPRARRGKIGRCVVGHVAKLFLTKNFSPWEFVRWLSKERSLPPGLVI